MNRPCPVCTCCTASALYEQRLELLEGNPLANVFDVVCCDSCGAVWSDTPSTEADFARYYSECGKYAGNVAWDYLSPQRIDDTATVVAEFMDDHRAKILDLGCAKGGLLMALRGLGFANLCGIDQSPACVEAVRAAGIEAHTGGFPRPFAHEKFDCVMACHLLEHALNPREAVRWMGSLLTEGGMLYLETPDMGAHWLHITAPFQEFNCEHINHFSIAMLMNLTALEGYALVNETTDECCVQIPTLQGGYYPALRTCWRRGDMPFSPDPQLARCVSEYIERSRRLLATMDVRLFTCLDRALSVIVWGTGQTTSQLLTGTCLRTADIVAFVDSNVANQGKTMRGVPVVSPEAIRSRRETIVIGSVIHQQPIFQQIRDMGLQNEVCLLDPLQGEG